MGPQGATGPIGGTGAMGPIGPAPSGSAGYAVILQSSGVATSTANLFVSSSNNVGIGVASPVYRLDAGITGSINGQIVNSGHPNWISSVATGYTGGVTVTQNSNQFGTQILGTNIGSGQWVNYAYSNKAYMYGAFCSCSPTNTTSYQMFGLTTNPSGLNAVNNYYALNYAWYFDAGNMYIYESGNSVGMQFPVYTTSTVVNITYDGTNIIYWLDGYATRTVARAVGSPLYAAWAGFYNVGTTGGIRSVYFDNSGDITSPLNGRPIVGLDCQGLSAQWVCTGGGTISFLSNATAGFDLYWSTRFICIPVSQQGYAASGYFDINCPTSGTITHINGQTTTTTVNCTSLGINLPNDWCALYYILPPGGVNTGLQGNFVVVRYNTGGGWTTNSNWILIGCTNLDGTVYFKCVPAQKNIYVNGTYQTSIDSSGTFFAGTFAGAGTSLTGTAVSLTAGSATTAVNQSGGTVSCTSAYSSGYFGTNMVPGVATRSTGGFYVYSDGNFNIEMMQRTTGVYGLNFITRNTDGVFSWRKTGGASDWGTELMFLNNAGNLGIGTASPNAPLNVWGSGPYSGLTANPQPGQLIINTTTGSERLILGVWYTGGTGSICSIQASDYYSSVDHGQGLVLNPLGGNVGIGTTSPGSALEVNGVMRITGASTTLPGINLPTSGNGIHWGNGYSRIYDDGDLRICTDDNMHFYTGSNASSPGTERITMLANGTVGINQTSPTYLVDVSGNGITTNMMQLATTNGGGGGFATTLRMVATGSGGIWGSICYFQTCYTAGSLFGGQGYGQIQANQYNDTGGGCFNINTNGTAGFALSGYANGTLSITSGRVYNSSDGRMKSNINYISETSTPKIMGLKPATFSFTTDPNNTLKMGFIAQDLEQYIPIAVDAKKYQYMWKTKIAESGETVPDLDENGNYQYTDEIRPRSVDNMAIIATLVKAFQEQVQVIEDLKQRIQILESAA